jgi:hypothetical protein
MTNMLERKYSKKVYVVASGLILVLLFVKGLVFNLPIMENLRGYGSLVIIVYTLIAAMLLFKSPFFEKLVWWGLYYIGLIIMELAAISFSTVILKISMDEIMNNIVVNNSITITTKVVTLLLFELFISRRRAKLHIKESSHRNISILVVFNVILVLGCVIVFFNVDNANFDMINVVELLFGFVLVTAVVTFFLVLKMERESRKELETKLKLQQIEMELKQNNDMINITDNLRKLRHDMNNHIGLIKNLIYDQKYDDLREYVDDLYGDVARANDIIVAENKALSVLLNTKSDKARELNIEFQSFVAASEIKMQDKDICALFGNILDNAIEAAQKSMNKKFIELSIQKTDSGCVIKCENSFSQKPVMKKGKFLSSKGNSAFHGIGVENIKDIVAKYNGEVKFDYDDEVFNLRIVMPI